MTSTIYQIYCKDKNITEVYIGSTENFHSRCITHNSSCHNENSVNYKYKVYEFIRANGGMENWIIEAIIESDEDTRYEAEVHYFKTYNSKLNTRFPRRSRKNYRIDNKEKIALNQKKYYLNNKAKYQIDIQCECGSVVRTTELNRHCRTQKHKRYLETKIE
jgi:hypothetical protein